jgi:hypothetical protein
MIEGQEHDEKVHYRLPLVILFVCSFTSLVYLYLFVYLYVCVYFACLFIPVAYLFVYKFVPLCVYDRWTYGVWVYFVLNSWLVNLHSKPRVMQKPTDVSRG